MLTRLRFISAGESHGPKLTAILEGFPAGLALNIDAINAQLARRQKGYGSGGRMKIERDKIHITSGWMGGLTTGAPIAFEITNRDWKNWEHRDIPPMTAPRPGHADLTGAIKYAYRDLRPSLERASARETATRVAAGAICRQLLEVFNIEIGGYTCQIGPVQTQLPPAQHPDDYRRRFKAALQNDLCCPDPTQTEAMRQTIKDCRKAQDTLGGVFEVVALNLPPGLGSFTQWDRRLEAKIAMAMMSIQAIKGVEIGHAFEHATRRGSKVHDEIFRDDAGNLTRTTNRAGGIEGGISNGQPLVIRLAKKPISTTLNPRRTIDLADGSPTTTTYERSDFCALPRAVPIGEAMAALVLADALLEKLGGDHLAEMMPRFKALRRPHLDDLPMNNIPWRFHDPKPQPS